MAEVERLSISVRFRRTIPKKAGFKARSYAQRVGMLLLAWNNIHGALADIFAAFIGRANMDVGRALWHAVKADTAQRDMLSALLPFQRNIKPEIAEAIEWLLEVSGKLSQHRNDVVHTPMAQNYLTGQIPYPDPIRGDPARVKRLDRDDLRRFHKDLTGDLIELSFYASYVSWDILNPVEKNFALPEMPRLRSIPPSEVPLSRSQKDRQKALQLRKHQRRASLGKLKPR